MATRAIYPVFPRNRYRGGATALRYHSRQRQTLARTLGAALKLTLHTRAYDRAASAVLDLELSHGCFGDELPADGARVFTLTPTNQTPSLPYNSTNMPNLPDDGTAQVHPTMGMVDVAALVSGGANVWVEFEMWVTAEFAN